MVDGIIGGEGDVVIQDLIRIKKHFILLGLELSPLKCEVFFLPCVRNERKTEILQKLNSILPGLTTVDKNKLTLLGAPLTDEAIPFVMNEKIKIVSSYIDKQQKLHPHVALVFLKLCFWIPKFTYLLRCCPMFKSI